MNAYPSVLPAVHLRPAWLALFLACVGPFPRVPGEPGAGAAGPYIAIKGCAYRLALGDVDQDGHRELIYAAYDGFVRCVDPATGELLWEVSTSSFPFALAVEDADGDGRVEVYAAAADGGLYAFNDRGLALWVFRTPLPLYSVDVGDVQAGGGKEIICGGIDRRIHVLDAAGREMAASEPFHRLVFRLCVADFDGDGAEEVFAVDDRTQADVWEFAGSEFRRRHRHRMVVPDEYINWENPRGNFYPFSLDVGDLDGDGQVEIVGGDTFFNKQAVMAMNVEGKGRWLTPRLTQDYWENGTWREFYSTAFVRVGEVDSDSPGRETMVVRGGMVEMLDANGQSLGKASALPGFTDLVLDGTTLYLGSTPNGDETIYRIDLRGDWVQAVRGLERQGLARGIGESIEQIWEQVQAYQGTEPKPPESVLLHQMRMRATSEGVQAYRKEVAWWKREFPYAMFRYPARIMAIEPSPPLDPTGQPWSLQRWQTDSINGTMTVEEILAAARFLEEEQVPFMAYIGHSAMPFITLETAGKMLSAAPTSLLGWLSAEDGSLERFPRYVRHWFGPLMDMTLASSRETGLWKYAATKNKGGWWASIPATEEVFPELFRGGRKEVLYADTEDSNSRTPELNLLARSGLFMAGLVDHWQVSCIHDLFSYCRFHQWEYPRHGHPFLRLLVAHTVLGGNHFHYRGYLLEPRGEDYAWTRQGAESYRVFLHMLGKGIVFPPERQQMVGVARIGLAMHPPPAKWQADDHNLHQPEQWVEDPELHHAVIPHNAAVWGNTPTPPHALQKVLLEKERQFGLHVPATPYGAPLIVPAAADLSQVPFVEEWWHTDGIYAWKEGGPRLTGMAAAEAIQADFARAAAKLPFQASGGVFFQTLLTAEGHYRLFAIDPGWLDPRDREVVLAVQVPGRVELRDLLSGENIPVANRQARFTVPAGTFRILEARVAQPGRKQEDRVATSRSKD